MSKIRRCGLFILLFLALYGPRFEFLDIMPLACIGLAAWAAIQNIATRRLTLRRLLFAVIAIFGSTYLALVGVWQDSPDWTGVQLVFKMFIFFFAADFLVDQYRKVDSERICVKILIDVVLATFFNALFVITVFFSPRIREVAGKYLFLDESNQHWIETGSRVFDISMGGGASGSFVFSIAIITGMIFWRDLPLFSRMQTLIIFAATALLGRTGFIISACAFILFFTFLITRRIYTNILIFLVIILTFLQIYEPLFSWVFSQDGVWFKWMFELFINADTYGKLSSGSTDVLTSMYFLPSSISEMVIGTGNYGRHQLLPYIPSDVGYVRMIWGGGIIGLLFIYGLSIAGVISVFAAPLFRAPRLIELRKPLLAAVVIMILFLLFNLKEAHLAARGGNVMYYLLTLGFAATIKTNENRLRYA